MRKYDFISALAQETAKEVVKNRDEWMKYLTTAARLYKYPFREQLLIYAQRPDATACASIEIWNERMHCWVNKGAKGIALIDEDDAHGKRLKYVFDVSDVHAARRIGRYPELWKVHEEHKDAVINRLEQTYGSTDEKQSFEEKLIEISRRIAADYYEELLPDLKYLTEGSFLDGLDEQNVGIRLRETLADSIRLEKGSYGNPYAKVLLNWNVVEKRLRELINEDKYLSAEGKVKYREYKEEQARAARQRELDRLEHGVRLNCKNAIESTIAEKFDGFILPRNTADAIVNEYGMECVEFVLANTIRHFDYDGRFSPNNKEWAKGIVAENEWQNNDLILNTHPAVLDGFTNQARRYISVLREKQREAESTVEKSVQEQNENATDEQELEWHIIHEADDENGKPTEWSTTIAEGQFLWIDKEENGYSIYDTADTGSNPLETFETLDQAKEWVEELVESGKEMEDELSQNAGQTSEIAQVTDIHELQDGDWVALDSGYTVDILSNQELHFNSDVVDLIGYDTSDGEEMRFKADDITEIHRNDELIAQLPDELNSIDTQAAREKLENGEADRQTEEMLSQVLTGEWEPVTLPSQGENKPIPDKRNAVNFHISNDALGVGTPKEKFRRNVEAIKLLEQIEGEHRYATPQEQEILSQYVGWGGLADAFDEGKQNWTAEYQELKNLLSPEEYRMARESTLNAHYTSPAIIRSMYDAIEKMGFTKGNILEPSMGIGNFFGMMPDSMKESRLYGVELDGITGRIAKQLYPQADVQIKGFEKTDYPNDFFDIAIGNVPFGQYKVADRAYDKNNFLIHDYFFGATRS